MWTFYDFVDERGRNVIAAWLGPLPKTVAMALNARLDLLAGLPPGEWKRPYVDAIGDGIHELRFLSNRVQYRPLWCFGPKRLEATLLAGAVERGGRFAPMNAPDVARERSTLITEAKYVCLHES